MENDEKFINLLTRIQILQLAKDEAIKDWGEDIPRTLLFAQLGKCIADKFQELSDEDRSYVFGAIESGMRARDAELKASVATGLLESMHSRASQDAELLLRIENWLGTRSREYLTAWLEWGRS